MTPDAPRTDLVAAHRARLAAEPGINPLYLAGWDDAIRAIDRSSFLRNADPADSLDALRAALERAVVALDERESLVDWRDLSAGEIADEIAAALRTGQRSPRNDEPEPPRFPGGTDGGITIEPEEGFEPQTPLGRQQWEADWDEGSSKPGQRSENEP